MSFHPAPYQSGRPAYLVCGDEPLLTGECADHLRLMLRKEGFSEREVLHVDGHFQWQQLLDAASMLSLFSEQKIIELRLSSSKLNKQAAEVLISYLKNPPPDYVLLILSPKIDGNSKKSAWFKTLQSVAQLFEIWPVPLDKLPQWISERAKVLGIQLTRDALQLLGDRIEGNLLAARQELDKLALLYPNQQIDVEQVSNAVSDSSRFDLFALTDAALAGQSSRSIKILHVLQQEGTESSLVIWALARETRLLLALQAGLAAGESPDQLYRKHGIWGARKQPLLRAAQRLSSRQLHRILHTLAEADRAIKGLSAAEPWLLLRDSSLQLAGLSVFES